VKLSNVIAKFSANETVRAEFESHFGGIVEIATCTTLGFFMLPSVMIAIELFRRESDELRPAGSSYLTYRYFEDILAFRRFGDIRQEELKKTFGTDYIGSTISPLLRKPSAAAKKRAIDELLATSFHDTELQVFSWSDDDLVSTSVTAPDNSRFRIERPGDSFTVFHSHEFSAEIAKRFGASRINYS